MLVREKSPPQAQPTPVLTASPDAVLALQRTAGNVSVSRLLTPGAAIPGAAGRRLQRCPDGPCRREPAASDDEELERALARAAGARLQRASATGDLLASRLQRDSALEGVLGPATPQADGATATIVVGEAPSTESSAQPPTKAVEAGDEEDPERATSAAAALSGNLNSDTPAGEANTAPEGPAVDERQAIVDPRIDVRAQFALLRLLRGAPAEAAQARSLFTEVKSGGLEGIFGDDLAVSARLAAARGTVRWRLVPDGTDAVRIGDGLEGAPVVVFRESAGGAPRLDQALLALGGQLFTPPFPQLPVGKHKQPPGPVIGTPELCTTVGGKSEDQLGTDRGAGVGVLAERFVKEDFCARMGCSNSSPPLEFFDLAGAGGGTGISFPDFVVHHETLTGARERTWRRAIGQRRPDIATAQPSAGGREMYEVKPNNPGGKSDARRKFRAIDGALEAPRPRLIYAHGAAYQPPERILMARFGFPSIGLPIDALLELERPEPGVVLWRICLRGHGLPVLLAALGIAAVLALLIALILTGDRDTVILPEPGILPSDGSPQGLPGGFPDVGTFPF